MQARFLVALPLLIAAELLVHQRMRLVVGQFIDRDIITEAVLPKFREVVASAMKLRNSVAIELILFILVYVGGYIVTQILTPVFSSAGFYIENLIVFIPQILASGLLAALLGVATIPVVFALKKTHFTMQDRLYYPVTIGVSAFCWVFVIMNTILIVWL